MDRLNYHHLLYFWTVAREGTIARAGEVLGLAQPTISTQLRLLDESLGQNLMEKSGRRLVLTAAGRTVYQYAEEIFSLGRELVENVKGRPVGQPVQFVVGLVDVLPKLVAKRLLEPALSLPGPMKLICREGPLEELVSELVLHKIDLILSDSAVTSANRVLAHNHLLGNSSISIFGVQPLARKYRKNFPKSLRQAPFLLQSPATTIRRTLDQWMEAHEIDPVIRAEFDDSALLKVFGQAGEGLFAAPTVIAKEICQQHGVVVVGEISTIQESFYAISAERRVKHPAVLSVLERARQEVFQLPPRRSSP